MTRTSNVFRGTFVGLFITTAACALSLNAEAAGEFGPKNPPPANPFQGYGGYELKPITLAPDMADKANVDKVVTRVEQNVKQRLEPLLAEWRASAGSATNKDTLILEPSIVSIHKPSGATRFFAGAFAGNAHIVLKVKITEQGSGKVIAEPEFYRRANAMGAAWSFGATDNAMLQKIAELVATYLVQNYSQAVGGATGYEP